MKGQPLILTLALLYSNVLLSQENVSIQSGGIELYGTLMQPKVKTEKAVLIISGSGITDRDGNTKPLYINNALKLLAEELTDLGYATLRYDKRGVGESSPDSISYENLRFEDYVLDASNWISYLNSKYSDVTLIGHSQGSLVGMMAIQITPANRFVSLAGLSEDVYTTLKRQLSNQPKFVSDTALPILDSLNLGVKVDSVPPYLNNLMGPSKQDYLMSFMKYSPREEIKKLNIPILVIQGNKDLQITVEGAEEMSSSSEYSEFVIVEDMNHVLKNSSSDPSENMATYGNPELPLHNELVFEISSFLMSQ